MAVVIDTNVFALVFDPTNKGHSEFAPVKHWIEKGDGVLLFGGTRFINEICQSLHRLRLLRRLKEAGMAIEIDSKVVDSIEADIVKRIDDKGCNDQHVMALLAAARCSLLCSHDAESFPFIKNRSYYPKGCMKVRIYSSSKNVGLLVRCNRKKILNAVQ